MNNDWIHIVVWAVAIGGIFLFLWWQGQIQRLAVYVQETREELKKCSWPSWEELKGSTALISIMIALLGGFIMAVDAVLFRTASQPMVQILILAIAGVIAHFFYKSQRQ